MHDATNFKAVYDRLYQGESLNGVGPADCGVYQEAADHLLQASQRGGVPEVRAVWDAISRQWPDLLAAVCADDQADGTAAPVPKQPRHYIDHGALRDALPPLGSFPIDALPKAARDMVAATAESTRTPPELAALLALAAIATALQGKARVQIHESWTEELCLYVAAVAQPGDGKSPVFAHMLQPIRRRAARLRDDHKQDLKAWDALAQEDKKSLPEPPEHPPRLSTTDTTPEKLAALMEQNNGKMSVLSAEAGIIGTLAGRYTQRGSNANIDLFLQAWNGEFVEIDRKDPNAPSLYLPRPLLSMAITMQPVVLESIRKNKELGARGLWDRFLLCYPAASPLSLGYDQPAVPYATREAWAALLEALFDMPESSEPPNIVIRPDALEYWNEELRLYERLGDGDYAAIRGVLKKGMSQLPRLAALLLIADNPAARLGSLPVTVEHARRAWAIYEALIPHFLKIAGQTVGMSGVIADARKLAGWLAASQQPGSVFSRREAQRRSPLRDSGRLVEALDYLREAGWLAEPETKSRTRRYLIPDYSPIFATLATHATDKERAGAAYDGDAKNGASQPVANECDTDATVCDSSATVEPPPATDPEVS
jgi:hypothetical protein